MSSCFLAKSQVAGIRVHPTRGSYARNVWRCGKNPVHATEYYLVAHISPNSETAARVCGSTIRTCLGFEGRYREELSLKRSALLGVLYTTRETVVTKGVRVGCVLSIE